MKVLLFLGMSFSIQFFFCQDFSNFKSYSLMGRFGFENTQSGENIPANYELVGEFSDGVAAIRLDGKWGFINASGKMTIANSFDDVHSFHEGLAAINIGNKWGFIDTKGALVIPCQYDDVRSFSEGLAAVKMNDKWGFVDIENKQIVELSYEMASDYSEGLAGVKHEGKWGFINYNGEEKIPFIYDYSGVNEEEIIPRNGFFKYGIANVQSEGKWGCIDKSGKKVTPFIYNSISSFENERAIASRKTEYYDNVFGLLDTNGLETVSCQYVSLEKRTDGFYNANYSDWSENDNGVIDKYGNTIVPFQYYMINDFSNATDRVLVSYAHDYDYGSSVGYINKEGNEVVRPRYDYLSEFMDCVAIFNIDYNESYNYEYGIVDTNGKVLFAEYVDNLSKFKDGLALISNDGKYGFLNNKGKYEIEKKYDGAHDFSLGMAPVKLNDKWGYITKNDLEKIPFIYDDALSFVEKYATVKKGNKWGIIDTSGKIVVDFDYDLIESVSINKEDFTKGLDSLEALNVPINDWGNNAWIGWKVKKGNQVFLMDTTFHGISQNYDEITIQNKSWFQVKLNNKYGLINYTGTEIIAPIYDNIYFTDEKNNACAVYSEYIDYKNYKKHLIDKNGKETIWVNFNIPE